MIVLSISLGILMLLTIRRLYCFLRYRSIINSLPGETSFSLLLGNLHKHPGPNEEGLSYDSGLMKKCRTFHRVWAGPVNAVVMLYHPDSIRPIVKSQVPKPRNKYLASPYDMGIKWLGEGILLTNGNRWNRHRRLINHAFHFDILKTYMKTYNACVDIFLEKMQNLAEQKTSFDIFHPVLSLTLDILLRCAFSYDSTCQDSGELNIYEKAMAELVILWTKRAYLPHLFNEFIYSLTSDGKKFYQLCDVVHKVSENIIKIRKESLEQNKESKGINEKRVLDFLDLILSAQDENKVGMSTADIRDEVDTFLFAGHDTTSSGLSWLLYALAKHPECQDKVYQEVNALLQGKEEVEWTDLSKLTYTTLCIKETLRLWPPVPVVERKLEEDMNICGHNIPAGTMTVIHLYLLHHNPCLWEDPEEFKPERFHPDEQEKMDPFQYLPFSAGTRNCIGQNFAQNVIKVTISKFILKYRVAIDPEKLPRQFPTLTLKAENGLMLYIYPRL